MKEFSCGKTKLKIELSKTIMQVDEADFFQIRLNCYQLGEEISFQIVSIQISFDAIVLKIFWNLGI